MLEMLSAHCSRLCRIISIGAMAGKALRQGDHALLSLVRAALGHNGLPHSDRLLITTVFYNHPSTTNVTLFFRTVPILPETIGRVAEINVGFTGAVKKGAQIFRLDSSKQEAAVESARRKVVEIDAQMPVARADVVKADGQLVEAKSSHQQAVDELETKQELYRRNPGNVAFREIERLQERRAGTARRNYRRDCREAGPRGADHDAIAGREGQRRGRARPGSGRARQDSNPRWRRWACRAVHAARR